MVILTALVSKEVKKFWYKIKSCDINEEFRGIIKEFCRRDWPIFAKNNGGGKGDFLFMLTKSENRVSFKCGFWNKLPRRILSA